MLKHISPSAQKMAPLIAARALALQKDARGNEADAAFAEAFRACTDAESVTECLRRAGRRLPAAGRAAIGPPDLQRQSPGLCPHGDRHLGDAKRPGARGPDRIDARAGRA